ncbi:hypothetical protein BDR05DRAFT_892302 [Suillus weaverae]|nr:hypothetical protein BDR05DRAFT_892302 [Suillus weaverae]
MVTTVSKKKKVVRTNEQCKLSKANSEAMWDDLAAERMFYLNTIKCLAKKYHTYVVSPEWMSGQMYLGGKLQKKHRNVCVFNAVVSDKIWELRENEYIGCDTLAQVTKEVSESGEWKMLSTEEKEELLEHMQDVKDLKAAKKVTGKEAAVDIENTMSAVQSELLGLEKHTGCNLMWILTCRKVRDIFPPCSHASKPLQTAFLHLRNTTVESIGMQVDAYMASGAAGVIKVTRGCKSVDLKAEIREMIHVGMREFQCERGILEDNVPAMAYTTYEGFVVKWGVELVGWTEGQVTNPGIITSSITLACHHAALKNHDCDWHVLSADEWEVKKDAHQQ